MTLLASVGSTWNLSVEIERYDKRGSTVRRSCFVKKRLLTLLLGLIAGFLICASLPPWGWWPLAIVGIALWAALLGNQPRLQRYLISWMVGLGWFAPSLLWMWKLTEGGYLAGLLLGWTTMVGLVGLSVPSNRWRLLMLPASVVLFEWFHCHAPFGGVPLSLISLSQGRGPLLPIARLGGGLLVSAAVAALGIALFIAVAERSWKEPVAVIVGCAILVGAGVASLKLVHPIDGPNNTMRVAAIQGGGKQGTLFDSEQVPVVFNAHLSATKSITVPVDLVIWPENAINVPGPFSSDPWKDQIAAEARRLKAPILVGVVEDDPNNPDQFLNYSVVITPDGKLADRYDKERRVPFGEYVPMRWLFEPLARSALPPRDAAPGVGSAMVETPAGDVAVAISWEVFFARRIREGVRLGGEVVLNPTNGSSYWLTQVQTQQLATSAFRAVESGRWLVQTAPTGFSAVFDDTGKILQRSNIGEPRVLFATVPRMTGTTPAQALGDVPALFLTGIVIALAESHRIRSRKKPDSCSSV